jgi:dihydrolipoamide dehydrogenase
MFDVVVIGAGPAGVVGTLRAAELGARTALVTSGAFGGMAANDGPVPVRTLAHAARLVREARLLGRYGITVGEPALDYGRLLGRVGEVVRDACAHSSFRRQIDALGATVHENAGAARFADPHTVETDSGLRLEAKKVILCTGGVSRRLPIPGFGLTTTHTGAWALTSVPPSMLVIGGGSTGVQVASIFHAFGSRVELFEAAPRILASEDADVAAAVAGAFRASGMTVREDAGRIESFEKTREGVRMTFSRGGARMTAEASLAVVAVGWAADTAGLRLGAVGVEATPRGFVKVDEHLRTTAPHVFAAGDVTGRVMLVPTALQDGFVAATNAVRGPTISALPTEVVPAGGFTHPEYAHVGLTEAAAKTTRDVVVAKVTFDETTRTLIDDRTFGFCRLVVDRETHRILGCHVVGEQAVEITQVAALAMAGRMRVEEVARVPLAFPTYTAIVTLVAAIAARQLNIEVWQANR